MRWEGRGTENAHNPENGVVEWIEIGREKQSCGGREVSKGQPRQADVVLGTTEATNQTHDGGEERGEKE